MRFAFAPSSFQGRGASLKKFGAALALGGMLLLAPLGEALAQPVQGRDYTVLSRPIQTKIPGKVEVTEFFSFDCQHCKHLQPLMDQIAAKLPPDAYVRPVHVVWNGSNSPKASYARLLAALELAGYPRGGMAGMFDLASRFTPDLRPLADDPRQVLAWLSQQRHFDGARVSQAYNSQNALNLVRQYDALTTQARVMSTPTVVVGGRYVVNLVSNPETNYNNIMSLVMMSRGSGR